MKLHVKIIDPRLKDVMPRYATPGAAGLDLLACIKSDICVLHAGQSLMIPTGIAIHIKDPGYAGLVLPRSGLGARYGIVLGNLTGLIDSDYQGELTVCLWNRSRSNDDPFIVRPLDRIAQLVIVPVIQAQFNVVEEFEASERGAGGFGSTGK